MQTNKQINDYMRTIDSLSVKLMHTHIVSKKTWTCENFRRNETRRIWFANIRTLPCCQEPKIYQKFKQIPNCVPRIHRRKFLLTLVLIFVHFRAFFRFGEIFFVLFLLVNPRQIRPFAYNMHVPISFSGIQFPHPIANELLLWIYCTKE